MERTISGLARWDYLGRPLKVGRTEMSLSIWQNCPIFRFENKPSSGAKRRFVFRPKYWAICVNIYFLFYSLVLFVASCFSTSFICTDLGLQLGDPAPFIGLLLWTCWYFLYWNPLVPARGLNFLSINIACPAFNKFITVGSRDHSCKVGSSSRCDRFFGFPRSGLWGSLPYESFDCILAHLSLLGRPWYGKFRQARRPWTSGIGQEK